MVRIEPLLVLFTDLTSSTIYGVYRSAVPDRACLPSCCISARCITRWCGRALAMCSAYPCHARLIECMYVWTVYTDEWVYSIYIPHDVLFLLVPIHQRQLSI